MSSKWRFILVVVPTFVAWTFLLSPLLPTYSRAVVPIAQRVFQVIRPHNTSVKFTQTYPNAKWEVRHPYMGTWEESISFRFLSYNLMLYLALLTAVPRMQLVHRAILVLSGLPVFFAFHVVDLSLAVESKMLTNLQPQYYEFWRHFSLWFVAVKFYHSFSAMAFKQVFPIIVVILQWHGLKKIVGSDSGAIQPLFSDRPYRLES